MYLKYHFIYFHLKRLDTTNKHSPTTYDFPTPECRPLSGYIRCRNMFMETAI